MGYYYQSRSSSINVPKENQDLVFVNLRRTLLANKDFSNIAKATTLPELIHEVGLEVSLDKLGNITGISSPHSKHGWIHEKFFYESLAKHGVSGDIQFVGEDGAQWRFLLQNGKMVEQRIKQIIWG